VDEAITAYKDYLNDFPDKTQARLNLGMIYLESQQYQNAIDTLDTVVEKEPNHADAHNSQGRAWACMQEWDKAKTSYDKAIAIDKQYAAAYFNKAIVLLSEGKYTEAWKEYEWRWKIPGNQPFSCAQPQWKGDQPLAELKDKTVLVHTEQGNTESILFARFLPQLAKHCKKVIVLCNEPMRLFFKGVEGVAEARLPGQIKNDSFDVYIPMMSLAGILNITVDNLPVETPYWTIPTEVVVPTLSASSSNKKVGIFWRSDSTQVPSASLKLDELTSFIEQSSDYSFYSLQTPITDDETALLQKHNIENLEAEMVSYAHVAKLIQQLDVLICVDSSIAQLASSLGVKVLLLLDDNPNWIWLGQGSKQSHWYPKTNLHQTSELENLPALVEESLKVLH